MADTNASKRVGSSLLISILIVFVLGRIFGADLLPNGWSFNHWQYLPLWYPVAWGALALISFWLFYTFLDNIAGFFRTRRRIIIGLVTVMILLIVFGFDSVLYGSGNLRIGQIAQADTFIYRWYEIGTIGLVSMLFQFFNLFASKSITAGYWAWKALSYGSVALSMVGAAMFASQVTSDKTRRFVYALLVFFGGQTLVQFGFVGLEVIIPPATIWFAYFMWKAVAQRSFLNTGWMWLVVLLGLVLHISMAFVVPAALFVTAYVLPRKPKLTIPISLGLVSLAGLIALVYLWASTSLEYHTFFLWPDGRLPNNDYKLFSWRHIGDVLQVIFLAAPMIVGIKWSAHRHYRQVMRSPMVNAAWLMGFGALIYVFVSDPRQSIPMEFPKLAAYLTAWSFFAVAIIEVLTDHLKNHRVFFALLVVVALFVPLSIVPTYICIEQSEGHVEAYANDNDSYYHDIVVAYRDAYFAKADYDNANRWEQRLASLSDEYLNIRGTEGLARKDNFSDAIRVLHQVIVLNPYWADPRAQLAAIQLETGRYDMAKPQIDTCLMLEPYGKKHHIHLYAYYRSLRRFPEAIRAIERALELWPSDNEIRSDQMLIWFSMGNRSAADSLAKELHEVDESLAFPYLVRGLIASDENNLDQTIANFQRFVELAPREAETPMIQARLDSLMAVRDSVPE